jgi:solute carrier family 35 protein F1/2
VLGQFLSLLLCGTGVTSQLLVSNHSLSIPTTQVFFTYVFLGAVYGVMVAVRSDFLTIIRQNWWKYIILGVVDLEANFLVVLAYRYTNLTTVQVCGGQGMWWWWWWGGGGGGEGGCSVDLY